MQIASLQVFRQKNRVVDVRYWVQLSESERLEMQAMLTVGEEAIARTLAVGVSTVYRTRRRFVEANLEGA